MFKRQKKKYKSKSSLIAKNVSDNKTFFKSGAIELSTEEILKMKLQSLNNLVELPKEYQQFRIVTQKSINSFDFILAILANGPIDELVIAFYRIGKKVVNELHSFLTQDMIKDIYFLVNDGIPKLIPEAYNLLMSFKSKKWNVRLAYNHTKIILIKQNNNFYVVEGSGNLSQNARIEQYCFDNNKELFEFHKNWIKNGN